MSRALAALGLVLAAGAGFVGWQVATTNARTRARVEGRLASAAAPDPRAVAAARAALDASAAALAPEHAAARPPAWVLALQADRMAATSTALPPRDLAAERARLAGTADAGYLPAIMHEPGGLARWPARATPLRVWVQPRAAVPGFQPAYASVARAAVATWDEARAAVRLVVTADSTGADVFVRWTERFGDGRVGTTLRTADEHEWLVAASVTIAVRAADGTPLDPNIVQDAARHELGHALGLGHSPDAGDVMAATAGRQARLSPADVAALRALYGAGASP